MSWIANIARTVAEHGAVVRVTVVRADGSTPRETGAAMLVSAADIADTIGGGALELEAIAHARVLLSDVATTSPSPRFSRGEGRGEGWPLAPALRYAAAPHPDPLPILKKNGERETSALAPLWQRDVRDFALGPSLGQCCGGYTRLLFEVFTARELETLEAVARVTDPESALVLRPLDGGQPITVVSTRKDHIERPLAVTRVIRDVLSGARPREAALIRGAKGGGAWFVEPLARRTVRLFIYGAGHVGRALVRVLQDLPFAVTWADTSADRLPDLIPAHVQAQAAPDLPALACAAPPGAYHIVMTYSHALDLAICHALLRRGDFGHLGLIGSATKRARFLKRLAELGIPSTTLARLTCPIGLPGISGKEPAVIAVAVAAQLVQLAMSDRGAVADNSLAAEGRHR
jgi:xanthine dehydrogenase accessory factor